MLVASSRLGPYEIVAPLGAGGMGEVYRARDTRLGREVAVKVLPEAVASEPDRQARFEREARAVAALSHPNILAIHDYGTQGAVTYAVMELLEGETLRSRLAQGPLPWREAVEVGAAIADGLAAAHAKGIVHRDLKPENLFLTADGRVKILDFGLARVTPLPNAQSETGPYVPAQTDPGTVMGTVGYMSPEQVRGQPADARCDLFSFGCVLYEMVTGRRAFQRETAAETMTAILHDEPSDPAKSGQPVPAELNRLIRQCLAKSPNQRLQSSRDLALALRKQATDSSLHRLAGTRPRFRLMAGMGAALLLIGLVATSVYFLTRGDKPSVPGTPAAETKPVDAIAVLPFVYTGSDPTTQMLSETLAEHISDCLRQVGRHDLKVRPLSSVSRYARQRPNSSVTIGQELNVPLIVTGTVRQLGDDLKITVEVVDAREDIPIWKCKSPYSARRGETLGLDLQDQIVLDVAANLGLRFSDEELRRLTRWRTDNKDAYNLYREAMYHFYKFTPEGSTAGIDAGTRAIEKDRNFAPAHAAVARCYILRGTLFEGPKKTFPEAQRHLDEALKLDPNLPEAHSALGVIYLFRDWNWVEAERELRLALHNDSNVILTRNVVGFCLAAQGRLDEALASIQRGTDLDPLAAGRWNELAMCYIAMDRYEQAIAAAKKATELDPNFFLAYSEWGTALIETNQHEEAIQKLKTAVERGKGHPRMRGLLGCAYAKAGKEAEARSELATLLSDGRFGAPLAIARIYATLGEKDKAFKWLHEACDERDSKVIWLKTDPALASLRSDPQFAEVLKEMGLPQ
jgi:serine/threonine protein kinase/tetratricopeptide (TPR) repeat protein